jgi:hypothetical protein
MSEILKKLSAHTATQKVREKSELARLADLLKQKYLARLQTTEGIAKEYGTDDELDLVPLSRDEDRMFCFEGSLVAYYCEQRLQDRTAEDILIKIYDSTQKFICAKCKKLKVRCKCGNLFFSNMYDI